MKFKSDMRRTVSNKERDRYEIMKYMLNLVLFQQQSNCKSNSRYLGNWFYDDSSKAEEPTYSTSNCNST